MQNWRTWLLAVPLYTLFGGTVPTVCASDRMDGPLAASDVSIDLSDLYSWMDPGGQRLNLVMTTYPNADKTTSRFSAQNLYVFHTMSRASVTDTSITPEVLVLCRFDNQTPQGVECWVGDNEYTKGVVATQTTSPSGKLTVFTGPRNDPFFMNATGANQGISAITTAFKAGTKDVAGCSAFSATNQTTVRGSLAAGGTDTYQGKNVLAIVVSVDIGLLTTATRRIVSVWASTNKQVL